VTVTVLNKISVGEFPQKIVSGSSSHTDGPVLRGEDERNGDVDFSVCVYMENEWNLPFLLCY
jgi:hypothetical protein